MRFIFNAVAFALVCAFAFVLILAVGCAGNGDLFHDPPATDAGTEIGSVEQGMSTKFSATYTHGVAMNGPMGKCQVGFAATGGCALPGYGTVRFKVTGTDPYGPDSGAYNPQTSWQFQARRMLGAGFLGIKDTVLHYGYGWPFGSAVEENTAQTWVEFTSGTCPDVGPAPQNNNIASYVCAVWNLGNSAVVTETQAGTYRRFTGSVQFKVDVPKIETYIDQVIAAQGSGCSSPCSATQRASARREDLHEVIEHTMGAVVPMLYGSGIYPVTMRADGNYQTWSSPSVWDGGATGVRFNASTYTEGESCRIGNWVNTAVGEFTQATGSCSN